MCTVSFFFCFSFMYKDLISLFVEFLFLRSFLGLHSVSPIGEGDDNGAFGLRVR